MEMTREQEREMYRRHAWRALDEACIWLDLLGEEEELKMVSDLMDRLDQDVQPGEWQHLPDNANNTLT